MSFVTTEKQMRRIKGRIFMLLGWKRSLINRPHYSDFFKKKEPEISSMSLKKIDRYLLLERVVQATKHFLRTFQVRERERLFGEG